MKKKSQSVLDKPWARSWEDVAGALDVFPDEGLDPGEARRRLHKYGPNLLKKAPRKSAWTILWDQVQNPIMALLAAAAVLSFSFGRLLEGISVMIVIVINGAIGFVTELKAVRSMEALHRMGHAEAKVLRGKQLREISSRDLVPGDIVHLEAGDLVPGDLRLVESARLQVNESSLTGESMPVSKEVSSLDPDTALAERRNMVFKGTAVTLGSGRGLVTATGTHTELGRIASLVEEAQQELTPLEKRLHRLAYRLIWVTLAIAALLIISGLIASRELILMIETSIALAVAAIPEGLPIVATIALARGMWRMARRNALINRLSAVETLGATNIICTDKTGTLTENRMTLSQILVSSNDPAHMEKIAIQGTEESEVRFQSDGEDVDPSRHSLLKEALQVGVLCNNAELGDQNQEGDGVGDPMEIALLRAGTQAGWARNDLLETLPEEREEAFDPGTMLMATFHKRNGRHLVAVKGAPEAVLDTCTQIRTPEGDRELDDDARKRWLDANNRMAEQGLRVLAAATRDAPSAEVDPYQDLVFIGLLGLLDPPRGDVAGAPLPILPLQILYLNMIGDVFPALALGVGKGDASKMNRPPRNPTEPILTRGHWLAVAGYGMVIAVSVLAAFGIALTAAGMGEERAVTVSFLTLAFARLWHIFNMRDAGSGLVKNDVTRNPLVWGALGLCTALLIAAVYLPVISTALSMVPPGITGWGLILGMSLIPLVIGQIVKQIRG